MRRLSRGLSSGLLAAAALLAPAGAWANGAAPAPAAPSAVQYVAMGSSFASGFGIDPVVAGAPMRCWQSAKSYPRLLAARLGLTLDDRTCSGATTAHISGPWRELPPQVDGVGVGTRLVTVTIGGNDLGYVGSLIAASCHKDQSVVVMGQAMVCPPAHVPAEADYAALEANLRAIAAAVRARAPGARLVFVQYLTLLPARPCAATGVSNEDSARLRGLGKRLAQITARVAHESGAKLLAADKLSRHHTVCDAVPWSHGFPAHFAMGDGGPWHPDSAGMAAIADALARMLKRV